MAATDMVAAVATEDSADTVGILLMTLSFKNAALEAEYLGVEAQSRWPVLMFIMTFDVICYCFRICAKCTTLYWRTGEGLSSSLMVVARDMGPQCASMIVLYTLIGLLNRRSKRLGDTAARQEELLLSVCMACAICSLLASLTPGNSSDYVYAAYFLICTSTFLKIRWWVGTSVMATPVAVAKLWHRGQAPVLLPSDAMVHIVVAWAVGGLMAYLAEWYRRQMFASQKMAAAAHQKELLEAQARIKAQRQLAAAQAQAAHRALSVAREKASNEAKSEFMSLMCHEVRTPLNGCLASAEMLLETPLTDEQHELAKTICVSGSILLSTVSNFLDFFKLEAGKALDVVRAEVNLQSLISDVHCIIEAMIGRNGQVCLLDPQMEGMPEYVVCDPDRVRGILLNLYTNAAKFTKHGHIGLRVREVARGHVPVPQEDGYAVVTAAPATTQRGAGAVAAAAAVTAMQAPQVQLQATHPQHLLSMSAAAQTSNTTVAAAALGSPLAPASAPSTARHPLGAGAGAGAGAAQAFSLGSSSAAVLGASCGHSGAGLGAGDSIAAAVSSSSVSVGTCAGAGISFSAGVASGPSEGSQQLTSDSQRQSDERCSCSSEATASSTSGIGGAAGAGAGLGTAQAGAGQNGRLCHVPEAEPGTSGATGGATPASDATAGATAAGAGPEPYTRWSSQGQKQGPQFPAIRTVPLHLLQGGNAAAAAQLGGTVHIVQGGMLQALNAPSLASHASQPPPQSQQQPLPLVAPQTQGLVLPAAGLNMSFGSGANSPAAGASWGAALNQLLSSDSAAGVGAAAGAGHAALPPASTRRRLSSSAAYGSGIAPGAIAGTRSAAPSSPSSPRAAVLGEGGLLSSHMAAAVSRLAPANHSQRQLEVVASAMHRAAAPGSPLCQAVAQGQGAGLGAGPSLRPVLVKRAPSRRRLERRNVPGRRGSRECVLQAHGDDAVQQAMAAMQHNQSVPRLGAGHLGSQPGTPTFAQTRFGAECGTSGSDSAADDTSAVPAASKAAVPVAGDHGGAGAAAAGFLAPALEATGAAAVASTAAAVGAAGSGAIAVSAGAAHVSQVQGPGPAPAAAPSTAGGSGGSSLDESRWLLFEVMDTGVGIAPEGLKSLFKEYVQGTEDEMKKPRTKGGTGLGLSICSKQVGVLGGRIGAYSCPGRGSVFWFTMPLITSALRPPSHTAAASAAVPLAASILPVFALADGDPVQAATAAGIAQPSAQSAAQREGGAEAAASQQPSLACAAASPWPGEAPGYPSSSSSRSTSSEHVKAAVVATVVATGAAEGVEPGVGAESLQALKPLGSERKGSVGSHTPCPPGGGSLPGVDRDAECGAVQSQGWSEFVPALSCPISAPALPCTHFIAMVPSGAPGAAGQAAGGAEAAAEGPSEPSVRKSLCMIGRGSEQGMGRVPARASAPASDAGDVQTTSAGSTRASAGGGGGGQLGEGDDGSGVEPAQNPPMVAQGGRRSSHGDAAYSGTASGGPAAAAGQRTSGVSAGGAGCIDSDAVNAGTAAWSSTSTPGSTLAACAGAGAGIATTTSSSGLVGPGAAAAATDAASSPQHGALPLRSGSAVGAAPDLSAASASSPGALAISPAGPPAAAPSSMQAPNLGRLLLAPGLPGATPSGRRGVDASSVKGLRALLVEDNLINQTVARKMLNSLGMQCEVASNGMEAVNAIQAALQRQRQAVAAAAAAVEAEVEAAEGAAAAPASAMTEAPYNVILMDMSMPVMGGVDATRAIRQLGCQVPIVAMTANASDKDRDECQAAGMDGFLSKPVLKDRLADAIMSVLESTRARQTSG